MLFVAVPAFIVPLVSSYQKLLNVAFFLGIAGSSFAVGVGFVSRWFPPEQQGGVLGIYGLGNIGQSAAVFLGRLLPVVRTFIALPAGVARMPRLRFHIYTFAGSWPWCYALAWVGMKLGERWDSDPRLKYWLHRLDAVIIVLLLVGAVWFVRSHWKNRLRAAA